MEPPKSLKNQQHVSLLYLDFIKWASFLLETANLCSGRVFLGSFFRNGAQATGEMVSVNLLH